MVKVLFFMLSSLLPAIALAQDARGQYADALAAELYCTVVMAAQSDLGLLFGLAVAAFGFIRFIFSGPGLGNVLMMAFGILFTAIPAFYEAGLDSLGQMYAADGGKGTNGLGMTISGATANNCDKGSSALKPGLIMQSGSPALSGGGYTPGRVTNTSSGTVITGTNYGYDENAPLNMRTNNPGNITLYGDHVYDGMVGNSGRFAVFDTPEAGFAQMYRQLTINANNHGRTSIGAQISRWAPPNENNTGAYINRVVSDLNRAGYSVNANSVLDLNNAGMSGTFMASITRHESGLSDPYGNNLQSYIQSGINRARQ